MKNKGLLWVSLTLLLLPLIIFFIGFLEWYVALICMSILFLCTKNVIKNENIQMDKTILKNKKTLLIVLLVLAIWLIFSGIGNISFQNSDFEVRNAILRDLINHKWPLIYDFSNFSSEYMNVVNSNSAMLIYYFSYWLPSALIGKIFNFDIANIFLLLYSFASIVTIVLLIRNKTGNKLGIIIVLLILFSGMDILCNPTQIFGINHIEWNFRIVQYSSLTTQLYWVYNQSIMIWLITSLIINFKHPSSILFISSISFCYSPFATFGMIPIALILMINKKEKKDKWINFIKNNLSIFEILFVIMLLIVFGSFYLSSSSKLSFHGLIWKIKNISFNEFLAYYIPFIIFEFLLFIIIIYSKYKKDILFKTIVIELLLIPFYQVTPSNDFCMRSSIVPLFLLMIYILLYLKDTKICSVKMILYILLLIGSVTPIHEIARSVEKTFTSQPSEYLANHKIYSIGNPITEQGLALCDYQFFSKNYDETFFYKYLSK